MTCLSVETGSHLPSLTKVPSCICLSREPSIPLWSVHEGLFHRSDQAIRIRLASCARGAVGF